MSHSTVRALVIAVGLVPGLAGAASAAPVNAPSSSLATVTCGSRTFTVVSNGGQNVEDKQIFSPGHVLGSTEVFIPVSFSAFNGTLTGPGGAVIFTLPPSGTDVKGSSVKDVVTERLDCTYTVSSTFPGDGTAGTVQGVVYTFSGTGEVSGFLTGRR